MHLQQEEYDIRMADDLPELTLVVIGLWNMGYTDLKTVAHVLWIVDLKPLRTLFKMLKTSKHPLIRRYVDYGLPKGVYRPLPLIGRPVNDESTKEQRTVRCKLCGCNVFWVPCPTCSYKCPDATEFPFRNRGKFRQTPLGRTSAAPGSKRKIELMRARYERGEQIFNPRDDRIPRKGD